MDAMTASLGAASLLALPAAFLLAQGMGGGVPRLPARPAPAGVRKLSPPAFDFRDIAAEAGLGGAVNRYGGVHSKRYILEMTGNGAAVVDIDNDGRPDIVFADGKAPRVYRNQGGGRFADATAQSGLAPGDWGQGICAGDIDNDGDTDLLLTYYPHSRLYRNDGKGRFTDITQAAGLATGGAPRFSTGCAFFDYDRDGLLDLAIANYVRFDLKTASLPGATKYCTWKGLDVFCGPRGFPTDTPILYRNEGKGRFRDVSTAALKEISGLHYGLGVVSSDFDGDGWPDLYIACDSTPGILLRNNRDGTLSDIAVASGAAYGFDGQELGSMGVAAVDVDGDGWMDLVKTNFIGETPSLYRNMGDLFFVDQTHDSGLGVDSSAVGWGIVAADFDHDMRPDLLMANGHIYPELGDAYPQPRSFYWNGGGGLFAKMGGEAGAGIAMTAAARGLAVGDLDGDGSLEVVIVHMNAAPALLKNFAPKGNALALRLEGTTSNRSAIGARVRVRVGGVWQVDEVRSGGSYASQHDFTLHFGLARAGAADRIEIRWPNGATETLEGIAAGARYHVREGSGVVGREAWR
jgi:hypothetical protein